MEILHHHETWEVVGFLIVVALLLWKGVPGMVGKMLDQRAAVIAAELEEAKRLRAEAAALLADYQKRAAGAEAEAAEHHRRRHRRSRAIPKGIPRRAGSPDRAPRRRRPGQDRPGRSRGPERNPRPGGRHRRQCRPEADRRAAGREPRQEPDRRQHQGPGRQAELRIEFWWDNIEKGRPQNEKGAALFISISSAPVLASAW